MSQVKVSVVIPVHNAEKYLAQCLSTVLQQTLTNIEVICVDDCSEDNSLDILKKYEKLDHRLKIIQNQNNEGAAASRNLGLKEAIGEYIVFLDSDDFFVSTMLEKSVIVAEQWNADLVYWGYYVCDCDGYVKEICPKKSLFSYQVINAPFTSEMLSAEIFQILMVAPWTRLIRREYLLNNNIYFQRTPPFDDHYFGCITAWKAARICYIDEPFVYYRTGMNTQMTAMYGTGRIQNLCKSLIKVKTTADKMKNKLLVKEQALHFIIDRLWNDITIVEKNDSSKLKNVWLKFFTSGGWRILGLDACNSSDFLYRSDELHWVILKEFIEDGDINFSVNEFQRFLDGELFRLLKEREDRYLLWGWGERGKYFLSLAKKFKLSISALVDCSSDLHGQKIGSLYIRTIDEITEEYDTILITNSLIGNEVKQTLQKLGKTGVKILDLDFYLHRYVSLDQCLFSI